MVVGNAIILSIALKKTGIRVVFRFPELLTMIAADAIIRFSIDPRNGELGAHFPILHSL